MSLRSSQVAKSYRRSEWICEVCGMWKYLLRPAKFGFTRVCPNSSNKDHWEGREELQREGG